jgi:ABC-type nitrate/sulfonate/bicarbonate transport system permease component
LINPALVPTPHAVFTRFVELVQSRLPLDIVMSTRRVFIGVLSGTALAVPVGFVLGWYPNVPAICRSPDQLLPCAAADRADSAGHRLLRRR